MDYQQQALDFLQSTNTKFSVKFLDHAKYFDDDDTTRDIYEITIARNGRKFVFKFGQSVVKSGRYKNKKYSEPTAYDVLAYLTKYDPGTFENFCGDFGYDTERKIKISQPMKLIITKANNQVTGVYIPQEYLGDMAIETVDYDYPLLPSDEIIEEEIDNKNLVKVA